MEKVKERKNYGGVREEEGRCVNVRHEVGLRRQLNVGFQGGGRELSWNLQGRESDNHVYVCNFKLLCLEFTALICSDLNLQPSRITGMSGSLHIQNMSS